MEQYKKEFIDFMVECQVLKFGSFTLKSGRQSPFFMNAGAYVTGSQLARLGEFYAKAIHDNFGDDIDVFFGPAYKGIPLAVVTAVAYSKLYGKEIKYCSDRKEEKDHGADKGSFLGSKLQDGDNLYGVMCDHGSYNGRHSWDPMTALMAIIGDEAEAGYDTVQGTGRVDPLTGQNYFTKAADGLHRYVIKNRPNDYYIDQIHSRIL